MDLEEGALMEPLSVGVHAVKRAGVKMGDVVVIFGSGPIGLVTMLAARAFGASKILITGMWRKEKYYSKLHCDSNILKISISDVLDVKLEKAKELGADYILKTTRDMTEEQITQKIREILKDDEPHCSFDCCGVELCVRVALNVSHNSTIFLTFITNT